MRLSAHTRLLNLWPARASTPLANHRRAQHTRVLLSSTRRSPGRPKSSHCKHPLAFEKERNTPRVRPAATNFCLTRRPPTHASIPSPMGGTKCTPHWPKHEESSILCPGPRWPCYHHPVKPSPPCEPCLCSAPPGAEARLERGRHSSPDNDCTAARPCSLARRGSSTAPGSETPHAETTTRAFNVQPEPRPRDWHARQEPDTHNYVAGSLKRHPQ